MLRVARAYGIFPADVATRAAAWVLLAYLTLVHGEWLAGRDADVAGVVASSRNAIAYHDPDGIRDEEARVRDHWTLRPSAAQATGKAQAVAAQIAAAMEGFEHAH